MNAARPRGTRPSLMVLRGLVLVMGSGLLIALGIMFLNRPRLALEHVASGFIQPTAMIELDGRLLVSQQDGVVRFVGDAEPFIDFRSKVTTEDWEQGFYDLELHPDFPTDDRLFVSYTDLDGSVVVESVSLRNAPDRSTNVITVPHPASPVHNGGRMAFGPDGYLYLGLGDGGPGEPTEKGRGQDPMTLLGKVIRIDVSPPEGYRVPVDNPFVRGGGAPEVWAYGLRNPWGISFDSRSGDLWVADVGQGEREEVNQIIAGDHGGRNFGWSKYEGTQCFRPEEGCDPAGLSMPRTEFSHADHNCSVVGGSVYRGQLIPWLDGRYLYSDYCSGRIWSVPAGDPEADARLEVDTSVQPTAIEVDAAGELYVLTYAGEVFRIVPAD